MFGWWYPSCARDKHTSLSHFNKSSPVMLSPRSPRRLIPSKLFTGSDSLAPFCLSCVSLTVWTNRACLYSFFFWYYQPPVIMAKLFLEHLPLPHKSHETFWLSFLSAALSWLLCPNCLQTSPNTRDFSFLVCKLKMKYQIIPVTCCRHLSSTLISQQHTLSCIW